MLTETKTNMLAKTKTKGKSKSDQLTYMTKLNFIFSVAL